MPFKSSAGPLAEDRRPGDSHVAEQRTASDLPLPPVELLAWAPAYVAGLDRGYESGWSDALVTVAADAAQLTPDHVAAGELVHRDRVAARVAEFERLAGVGAVNDFALRNLHHDLASILALPDEPRFAELRGRAAIRLRSLRVSPPRVLPDYVPYRGGPVAWETPSRRVA